jgi:hypothetical protein
MKEVAMNHFDHDDDIVELGVASEETKGLPQGSTEQVGLIKSNGISDDD